MEKIGGWRRNFKVLAEAQLRWLGTVALAVIFLYSKQATVAVLIAAFVHICFWLCHYVSAAFTLAQSESESDITELTDFVLYLPESKIWWTTTKAVMVAFFTTFFPRGTMAFLAVCYLVVFIGWILFSDFVVPSRSEIGQKTRFRFTTN